MKHKVMYKNLELEVDDGVLYSMHNGGAPCKVVIPKVLPNGEQISKIGAEFLKGEYKIVVIPDEITEVAGRAFQSATVDAVVWSAGCKIIPQNCFYKCTLRKLTNAEKVEIIGDCAFFLSYIEKFVWPQNCLEIPESCFNASSLRKISGIENVTEIQMEAFANCDIRKIIWPSGCNTIPYGCFRDSKLEQIDNIDNVKEIHDRAFADSNIQNMDLSRTIGLRLFLWAFKGLERDKIIPPYYIADDDLDWAFEEW